MTATSTPALGAGAELHLVEADDVVRLLGSDAASGLSSAEAGRRLARNGPNELEAESALPLWRRVVTQFADPLVVLLLGAVLVSALAWFFEGATGVPIDAVVISGVLVVNAALGFTQQNRAEAAVAALERATAVVSTVLRDGHPAPVPSSELVTGDLLFLAEGDAVGADARLVQAAGLRVSEASLTGESEPVTKTVDVLVGRQPLGDRVNMVHKGTAVTQGSGRAVVTATGMDTETGAIAHLLRSTHEDPTPLEVEIAHVGKVLGVGVVVIALVTMATIWAVSDVGSVTEAVTVLLLGVSLAVAAVPEGLPAVLSVVLSIGVQRMAAQDAVVKRLSSVETLGSASVICSDKTGTLTRNEMTLQRIVTDAGTVHLSGVGYEPTGGVLGGPGPDDGTVQAEDVAVLSGGALASNADLRLVDGEWRIVGDPTEAAFLVAEMKLGLTERRRRRFSRIAEVPFTSGRKLMSTVEVDHEHADARVLVCKGAPDVLLPLCDRVRTGTTTTGLDEDRRARILADVESMSADALRTLAVGYRPLLPADLDASGGVTSEAAAELEDHLVYAGTVGIIDPARAEVAVAVAEAHRAGIRVVMITGDHPATAMRIAQDLGITDGSTPAVSGTEVQDADADELRTIVATTSVYARVAPEHKLRIVHALRAARNVVAMTGDGVNDAPALKAADIGVAMGITGTEVTKESAAMILADDNFATIVLAVRQGRVIFDNIKKFLRYLLSSNMGEVLTVFGGVVLSGVIGLEAATDDAVVLPLLATQILWINLVTDSGPALAMGVDPETDDVMARAPRRPEDRIIDAAMWRGVVLLGLVIAAATLLTIDVFLPGGLVPGDDSLEVARTCGFTTLVLAQLFNAFNSRSETTSAFHRPFVNRWLWAAVTLGLLAQVAVVEVPFLQAAFGTASLDGTHWLVCAAMASSVLWFDELRKLSVRLLAAHRATGTFRPRRGDLRP